MRSEAVGTRGTTAVILIDRLLDWEVGPWRIVAASH